MTRKGRKLADKQLSLGQRTRQLRSSLPAFLTTVTDIRHVFMHANTFRLSVIPFRIALIS
ncbi:hypothetical protein WUBG_05659, partial [Wuchereria bancrofti]